MNNLSEETFREVLSKTDRPVVVDFYADWCAPCKALAPFLESLSDQYSDSIDVYNVDIMKCQNLAAELGITSIPFIGVFKGGEMVKTSVGFGGKEKLEKLFEEIS